MDFSYDIPLAFIGLIVGLPILTFALAVLVISSIFLRLPRRATSYCAFLLGGLAVSKLQWMIFIHKGGEEVAIQMLASILYVTASSIVGFFASLEFLLHDKYIQVIILMTFFLGALLAAFAVNVLSYQILNFFACIYALICITFPAITALPPKGFRF